MATAPTGTYDPHTFRALSFHDAVAAFRSGTDTPRDYLERCIAAVESREPVVRAFAHLDLSASRAAADASTARWRAGSPTSPIDGMPIGIKDLLETKDMPTEMNCEAMRGNFPKRDNVAVAALRAAGVVIFGKLVTAELGGSHPGPTTNPFNPTRTPGGSSSGSAAAVGARMMPAAIGSQVGGSIIRPAGYCGNYAMKPTQGGINRGERQATSMSTHGVHAGSLEDMWQVSIEIAERVGGDPGRMGLVGPMSPPSPVKPQRVALLETEGWADLDAASKAAFQQIVAQLEAHGIEVASRQNTPEIETLEGAIASASRICSDITGWENRWYQRNLVNEKGGGLSARAMATLERAERMTPRDYRARLLEREHARLTHDRVGSTIDACITLACPGPATPWAGDEPGEPLAPRPTGHAIFNFPSSMLFAPVVTVPLMAVGGLPVGVQIMGRQHEDARITAFARWLMAHLSPVAVS